MQPSHIGLQLAEYWDAASSPIPIVVVGGGRWGRTWAGVIASARGTAAGLTMVARTDPEGVREWLEQRDNLRGAIIVNSFDQAMQTSPRPVAAIIASRPRDHLDDGYTALGHNLHVLMEKPISPAARASAGFLAAAKTAGRVLAVGTEFALLPAFHEAAMAIVNPDARNIQLRLRWDDTAGERRHGGSKIHHEETSILVDLLAHAVSIFRIFAPRSSFRLIDAIIALDGNSGYLSLSDAGGARFELHCNRASSARQRLLEIAAGSSQVTVDFSRQPPAIVINGQIHSAADHLESLSSTLRLELGAFLMEVAGTISNSLISTGFQDHVRLQAELETALLPKDARR